MEVSVSKSNQSVMSDDERAWHNFGRVLEALTSRYRKPLWNQTEDLATPSTEDQSPRPAPFAGSPQRTRQGILSGDEELRP